MDKLLFIGICAVVILIMCIQIYRSYSWESMIKKKQGDYVTKTHVRSNTKQYYAPLCTAVVCMFVLVALPQTSIKNETSADQIAVFTNETATDDSSDGIAYAESAPLTTNQYLKSSSAAENFVSVINEIRKGMNDFDVVIQQVNPKANEYVAENFISIIRNAEITEMEGVIDEHDYIVTIYDDVYVETTYALKEYEDYYVLCDAEYNLCYYISK